MKTTTIKLDTATTINLALRAAEANDPSLASDLATLAHTAIDAEIEASRADAIAAADRVFASAVRATRASISTLASDAKAVRLSSRTDEAKRIDMWIGKTVSLIDATIYEVVAVRCSSVDKVRDVVARCDGDTSKRFVALRDVTNDTGGAWSEMWIVAIRAGKGMFCGMAAAHSSRMIRAQANNLIAEHYVKSQTAIHERERALELEAIAACHAAHHVARRDSFDAAFEAKKLAGEQARAPWNVPMVPAVATVVADDPAWCEKCRETGCSCDEGDEGDDEADPGWCTSTVAESLAEASACLAKLEAGDESLVPPWLTFEQTKTATRNLIAKLREDLKGGCNHFPRKAAQS